MSRCVRLLSLIFLAGLGLCLAAGTAAACPMCAETVAADDHLPRAYMTSIIFMLGMPALVFTGFSLGIYRAIRKHADATPADEPSSDDEPSSF